MMAARPFTKKLVLVALILGGAGLLGACTKGGGASAPKKRPAAPAQPRHDEAGPGEQPPAKSGPIGEIVMDPTGLTPDQIFAASAKLGLNNLGEQAEGLESKEPLFYSGSSPDLLREQLLALLKADKEDADQAAADRDFARRVGLVTVDVNWQSRAATVTAEIQKEDSDEAKSYTFKGTIDDKGHLEAGDLDAKSHLAVQAVCMDMNGGCNTVHLRVLRLAKGGGIKSANVIARRSNSYLYINGNPAGASNNSAYDRLVTVFNNTVYNPGAADRVREATLYTSETLQGGSQFALSLRMGLVPYRPNVQETMLVRGSLVKPKGAAEMNLELARPTGSKGSIKQSLREVRLVKNDGAGNLQLALTVRKSSAASSEDTLLLTVARIHEAIRSPSAY